MDARTQGRIDSSLLLSIYRAVRTQPQPQTPTRRRRLSILNE